MIWHLVFIVACLNTMQGGLAIARDDFVPGSRYTSARAEAMGDAYLPIGDDAASALFYNPAVLGKIRHAKAEAVNLSLYGNVDYLNFASWNKLGFLKFPSLSSFSPTLQENPSITASGGGALLPAFAMPGLAVGVLMESQLASRYNDMDGTIGYKSRYQLVPAIATGVRLAGGIVRLGYSLHWVNQANGEFEGLSTGTSPLGYNQGLMQGSGFSHNLGFALTLPIQFLPSLNIVGRNVFSTSYHPYSLYTFSANSSGLPPADPMTFDVSLSVQPKIGSGAYFNFVVEDRDVTSQSGMSIWGRVVLGAEMSFRDQFFIRTGWGTGYPSFGLGLRRASGGEMSLTWFSEEVGSSYHSVRDIRYLFQYQVRAF